MKLFFNIFNIKKIENSIGKKITIFDYEELKTNPETFINKLSIYMNIKISHNLIKKLKIKTRVSPIHENNYLVKKPTILFDAFKKIIPKKLRKIFLIKIFSNFLYKKITIDYDHMKLDKLIKSIHKK